MEKEEGLKESVLTKQLEVEEVVESKRADNTLAFMTQHASEYENVQFTEEEQKKAHRALYLHLFPLIYTINTILLMDKATLSFAAIQGLYASTGIDTAQYNDTNSLFYTGYIIGELMNFLLQKSDMRKFLSLTLFIWAIIVFLHCTASSFAGLMILRFFLGFFESVILPALEITMLQFFAPKVRATLQPVFWTSSPLSTILSGFISYGTLHATESIPPWKIFMIVNGGITLLVTVAVSIWYPTDPTKAKFLTTKQKYFIIKEVQEASHSAISQKVVKKDQVIECLKDPISWLFCAIVFCLMLANNLAYQQTLLYVSLGVSTLGTTLVSSAGGGFAIIYWLIGALIIHYWPNHSAHMILYGCIPSFAAGIAMITIAWDQKLALVACLTLGRVTFGLSYIVSLGWSTSSAGGNTKRYVRHLMFMISYSIANIISPQLWQGNQAPRYRIAWTIQIVFSWGLTPVLGYIIEAILKSRNKKRLATGADEKDPKGAVTVTDADGNEITEEVPIANLDLTDRQNKYFIYPL